MNTWGEKLKITLFGESHGPSIGVVIDGLKAGTYIDEEYIASELARRAPGQGEYATARKETDKAHILSGVKDGHATGAPITCVIYNENARSADYDLPLRPGHADWTGLAKYGRYMERSGGGRFSGRLTAPLVFAGAIAKSVLAQNGIRIYGRIRSIGNVYDDVDLVNMAGAGSPDSIHDTTFAGVDSSGHSTGEPGNSPSGNVGKCPSVGSDGRSSDDSGGASLAEIETVLKRISPRPFPALEKYEKEFRELIAAAKKEGDSVGGVIEVVVFGAPAGLGEPFFGSVESMLSSLYFSVPAVKGVEFGKGFAISEMHGSEANDSLALCGDDIISETNNNGGVLGGISNGMPIIARVAVKPTASIAKPQRTVTSVEEIRQHDGGSGLQVAGKNASGNPTGIEKEYDVQIDDCVDSKTMAEGICIDGKTGQHSALAGMKETKFTVRGRHDPSIVPRAVPVIESVTAIGLLDLYYRL